MQYEWHRVLLAKRQEPFIIIIVIITIITGPSQ